MSLVFSFAHTAGELGVVLMAGANIDGITRTVSIDVYDDVQALDYSQALRDLGLSFVNCWPQNLLSSPCSVN
ncbi:MAG: hypothetical protein ACRD1R_21675 [Acidobacteriota bacterium]